MTIQSLIYKQDNFEIIRDQIASILVLESASQIALATTAGKPDPSEWKLRVFKERSNPIEEWLNDTSASSPIINVWYDNSNFDLSASNVMERQKAEATFNIDCYAYGVSSNNASGGHNSGDEDAALKAQKALRLVRNILMASEYTYLGLPGLVWRRMPQSISVFQPQIDAQQLQKVMGARISLSVIFNEFSPQYQAQNLEYLAIDVSSAEDGELTLEADYDYT